jgi:hypothetical protein
MKKNERAGFWAALEGKAQQARPVTEDRDSPAHRLRRTRLQQRR